MRSTINQIISPINTSDGAGVKLKRSIGTQLIDYFDPFLMLDEFGSDKSDDYLGGFPAHPHRGIETVTYMLNGEFEHKDSTGAVGIMKSGDVQWMKTGSGIIHSEMPAMSEGKLHGFQLWINMPAEKKMDDPEYIYLDSNQIKTYEDSDVKVKVIAGSFKEIEGSIKKHNVNPTYLDIQITSNQPFTYNLDNEYNSFIYVYSGSIHLDGENSEIKSSHLITFNQGGSLVVTSENKAKFLLVSGKPIGEPIARGGPFVMNTREEIISAISDYNNGTFVKVGVK